MLRRTLTNRCNVSVCMCTMCACVCVSVCSHVVRLPVFHHSTCSGMRVIPVSRPHCCIAHCLLSGFKVSQLWLKKKTKQKNSDLISPHTASSLSFIGTCSNGVHLIFQHTLFVEYNFWWQHYDVQYTPVHTCCTNIDRMSCDCGVHGSNTDHSKLK